MQKNSNMRRLLFLFVAAATVVFSSCSKDDNNDGIQLTKTDLVGEWNVTSIATSGDFSNVPSGGILISVKNDDSYTVKFFSDMYVGRYEIKGNTMVGTTLDPITEYFKFESLEGNKAQISYSNSDGGRYQFKVVKSK